ncbi:MAG: flagellar protein [Lachnospiraceae bacterium]|nr:flagellar protein [Lachnospiraceae bacterium]
MDVRNCKKCNKIFNYVAGPMICPACKEESEHQFQRVKDFIRDNKNAGIAEICEECDVTEKMIKQWIREERLLFGADSPVGIDCEGCGTMIRSGRYCDKCKNELARGIMEVTRKPQEDNSGLTSGGVKAKSSNKMRFL